MLEELEAEGVDTSFFVVCICICFIFFFVIKRVEILPHTNAKREEKKYKKNSLVRANDICLLNLISIYLPIYIYIYINISYEMQLC